MQNRTIETSSEDLQAAFFDFDGLVFRQESVWKIANPHLGVIGSRIHWKKACEIFDSILIQQDPATVLTDHFHINEYELPTEDPMAGWNILPMASLFHTAQNHKTRGQGLYLISSHRYRGLQKITEPLYEKFKKTNPVKFRWMSNPFEDAAEILPPFQRSASHPEEGWEIKIEMIRSRLRSFSMTEIQQRERFSNVNGDGIFFEKIFYYYSEPEFRHLLEDFLFKEMRHLTGGRNAIVPVLIAEPAKSTGGPSRLP